MGSDNQQIRPVHQKEKRSEKSDKPWEAETAHSPPARRKQRNQKGDDENWFQKSAGNDGERAAGAANAARTGRENQAINDERKADGQREKNPGAPPDLHAELRTSHVTAHRRLLIRGGCQRQACNFRLRS